ncbi:hypothetical protein LB503_011018 [Fusarium chuoi]|nr:hypothetical protein LB503_011018 [Fusarium chuoi]
MTYYKHETKAPDTHHRHAYIQCWAPDGPNHVQPRSVDVRRDRNPPRGSIDSSSTGMSAYSTIRPDKSCKTFVILFEESRPLIFTLRKRPIKITQCDSTSIKIHKRTDDSVHVCHPPIYQVWQSQDPPTTFRRPCLPIEPEAERLLDLNNVALLKIRTIIVNFGGPLGKIQY